MSKNQTRTTTKSGQTSQREVRTSAPQVRGDRGTSEDSQRTETGLVSVDELKSMLANDQFIETALPTPPALPGYHLCWISTTSTYDTPFKRQRLGYTPVRQSEMPGFDSSNGQSLQGYEGFVTCNEMLLVKIPLSHWQLLMKHYHHARPAQDEQSIVDEAKRVAEQHQTGQKSLLVDSSDDEELEGLGYLEQSASRARSISPTFS